jgi:hypothetical protein
MPAASGEDREEVVPFQLTDFDPRMTMLCDSCVALRSLYVLLTYVSNQAFVVNLQGQADAGLQA